MMIKLAQQLSDECTPLLISSSLRATRELDVDVLEGVAKARYTLALTAEYMYKSTVENTEPWNDRQIKMELETLFETTRRLCYKSLSPAPRLFLLKQLARRFGVETIHVLCGRKELEWIVPPESRNKQVESVGFCLTFIPRFRVREVVFAHYTAWSVTEEPFSLLVI